MVSNYLSSLLQPGGPDAGWIESAVDCLCLSYPRKLWLDREVIAIKRDENLEMSSTNPLEWGGSTNNICCPPGDPFFPREGSGPICSTAFGSCNACTPCAICCVCVVFPFNFVFLELPALICSGLGMPIKATILAGSERAQSYSNMARQYLKLEHLRKEKELIVNTMNKRSQQEQTIKGIYESRTHLENMRNKYMGSEDENILLPLLNHEIESKTIKTSKPKNDKLSLNDQLDYVNAKITKCQQKFHQCERDYALAHS